MENNISLHPVTRWRLGQEPTVSIADLAARAEVDRCSLSMVEGGRRERLSGDANLRIAQLTGIDLLTLMTWRWTKRGRAQARKVLGTAAREFRARAAAKRRKAVAP